MGIINRRVLRGMPLDDQCKDFGGIIREADGRGDPRRYCTGYSDGEGVSQSCSACKAFIKNMVPWRGERFGVLPGQISIDDILKNDDKEGHTC